MEEFDSLDKEDQDIIRDILADKGCGALDEPEEEPEEEPRYSAISFAFRNTPDHNVDIVMELLDDWLPCDHGEEDPDCYLMSMGGCTGTEEQVWKYLGTHKSVCEVKTDDLKLILRAAFPEVFPVDDDAHWEDGADWSTPTSLRQAYERLRKEAYWHDEFEEWLADLPDEEE